MAIKFLLTELFKKIYLPPPTKVGLRDFIDQTFQTLKD